MAGSPPSARPDLASADLRALLDAADVAVVGRTMPGDVITCWNAGAEALYGWPRAEALGRAAGDLLRTAYPRTLAAIAASLARERRWAGELHQTTRAARRLVVESRWTPRRDGDGAPLVALAIERDVTAERRTEARLRGLLEAAPDAMIVADERGRIALANGQVERLFGYASDDLLGRPVEDLLPEAVRARHVRQREAYGAAPHARPMGIGLELAGRRRDGATFPVEVSLSPLPTDEGLLVIASIRDVTERHHREARQRFLAGAGEILAAALDYEQTLVPVARLAVPVLADYTAVDLVDDRGRLRRIGMAHREPDVDAALQARVSDEPLVLTRETPTTRALATLQTIRLTNVAAADLAALAQDEAHLALLRQLAPRSLLLVPLAARRRALGVLVLAYSASARRYGEEDQALAEELAHRMGLALDNARLYREAREALAARDVFLSTISHDLRNPLAVATMAAQTLAYQARRETPVEPGAVREATSDIDRAVARADAMVEQLLDVARLQAGRPLAMRRRTADLVALARQAAADQQRLARAHTIVVAAAEERLVGRWDAERVERVVANLVGNAVKYSPAGGAVTLTLRREGDQAVLSVGDQGIGIPAADLERVFQPFQRASNVGAVRGTGVGLASAKQIVEQHDGSIAVESVEGRGTTVTIRLPLPEPDGEPPARA